MKTFSLKKLSKKQQKALIQRKAIDFRKVNQVVESIINQVKKNGDIALEKFTKKFDGIVLKNFKVTKKEIADAKKNISKDLMKAITVASKNIQKFHKAQKSPKILVETMPGIKCWQKSEAIEKVGLYVPGGSAPLPSTVLMLGIPAKIAGCKEIVLCTPPNKKGKIDDSILFTADLIGVTQIFKIGGAQAIAAMAYGTKSIPQVYKIFGPGNQYVTSTKMLVSTEPNGPAIDMPAGPSELLIIADKGANPKFVAADLLSQAEHGPDSQVVLVATDQKIVKKIEVEITDQIKKLSRKQIAQKALKNSFTIICENLKQAFEFSNLYAPEHLILNIQNAKAKLNLIKNAGSVFVGKNSCESIGDYASGTNHTLPTYGYAKNYSGVNLDAFVKKITFQEISTAGLKIIGPVVEKIAIAEGLDAHKNAVSIRLNSINK
ncbi:histidinol dehydrogenase [Patescibacteria group bacterium]